MTFFRLAHRRDRNDISGADDFKFAVVSEDDFVGNEDCQVLTLDKQFRTHFQLLARDSRYCATPGDQNSVFGGSARCCPSGSAMSALGTNSMPGNISA